MQRYKLPPAIARQLHQLLAFSRFIARRFNDDQCFEAAGALSFTTVFAMVPLFTVALSVFASFEEFSRFSDAVINWVFEHFVPTSGAEIETKFLEFIDGASQLTAVGTIALFISGLLLMTSIEHSFNRIWRVVAPRRALARFIVFWTALTNTMIFLVFQVPIMIVLALFMASVLNDPKLKFRGFFRTCMFLPAVTSLVAYAILFKGMFATDGVVNSTLTAIGIINDPVPWFSDPFWAKVLVIMAVTWRWVGYNMIFYLAALQNIDRSIYEAASIDGIPSWGRFFRLTVPMLKPVILFTTVTSTIGTIQMFDEVHNLTAGGPGNATMTLSMYIYKLTFVFMPNFGYAATISYVIVFLVALLALAQFYVARERK